MASLGRILIFVGAVVALIGLALVVGDRLGFRVGRLPGDFRVHRGHFTFYFPLATSIVVSVVLTLVMWLVRKR